MRVAGAEPGIAGEVVPMVGMVRISAEDARELDRDLIERLASARASAVAFRGMQPKSADSRAP
jgi:hypothetical protein